MWWPTVNCANDRLDLNFKSFEWQNPTLDKISFVSQRNKICVHTNIHTPCNTWTYYWSISQKFVYGFLWQCEITLDSFKTYSRKLILKTKRKKTKQKGHHLNIKCCDPTTCVFYAWLYVCHDIRVHKETHVWLNNLRCNWVFFIFILSAFLLLMFLTLFFCCFVFILSSFGTSCSFNLRLLTVVFFVGLNNPWRY